METLNEIIVKIDKIREIVNHKGIVKKDHFDFNKEKHLHDLDLQTNNILDDITASIGNGIVDFIQVAEKPSAAMCDVLLEELNKLQRIKDNLTNFYFNHGYVKGRSQSEDQRYQINVKPIDDFIERYNDMYKLVALLNAPDDRFIEAMEVMYDRQVNPDQINTVSGRFKLLSETEMVDAIPFFYSINTLCDKIDDLIVGNNISSKYIRIFKNTIIGYTLRPALSVNILEEHRLKFDDLLNELYPAFSGTKKALGHLDFSNTNSLSMYEANRLYEVLINYCHLYETNVKADKIEAVLNKVKIDENLMKLENHYENLATSLLNSNQKEQYMKEQDELKKSKNPFGKKQRIARIQQINGILQDDAEKIKELNWSDTDIFNQYFASISQEAENNGIRPADIDKVSSWEELKSKIKKEIENIMAHAAIDGSTLKYKDIIREVLFPFELCISIAKDNTDNFIRNNNTDIDVIRSISIDKILDYIELYKHSQCLYNGTDVRTTTPYSKDLVNYFTGKSWMNVAESYQNTLIKTEKVRL